MSTRANDSVLVTGASRGIGMESALGLAQAGFRVWAGMRDLRHSEGLIEEARRRGVSVDPVRLDVTDPVSMDEAFATIRERSGALYGLLNNAGITKSAYFEDFPEDELRRIVEVDLFGVMAATRRALPLMRAAGRGRVVMLSSIGGRIGSLMMSPYFAAKFAIEGFAESLFLELAPMGIQVVLVEPGLVKTDIWEDVYLPEALDERSPYFNLSRRVRQETDRLLQSATLTAGDVASVVCRAFTARRPRLRYVVGWKAGLLISLRRHLPGELFEKLYFGEILRRIGKRAP